MIQDGQARRLTAGTQGQPLEIQLIDPSATSGRPSKATLTHLDSIRNVQARDKGARAADHESRLKVKYWPREHDTEAVTVLPGGAVFVPYSPRKRSEIARTRLLLKPFGFGAHRRRHTK